MKISSEQILPNEVSENLKAFEKKVEEAKESIFEAGVVPVDKRPGELQQFATVETSITAPKFEKYLEEEASYWKAAGDKVRKERRMSNEEEKQEMGYRMAITQTEIGRGGKEQLEKILRSLGEEQLQKTHDALDETKDYENTTRNVAGVEVKHNQEFVNYGEARTQVVNNLIKHYEQSSS